METFLSDEALCELINAFWRTRGFEARARVERRQYTVKASTRRQHNGENVHSPETKSDRREIVSDLVNGGPSP
jgi:hypothetical protein